jgi:hypothetical protein
MRLTPVVLCLFAAAAFAQGGPRAPLPTKLQDEPQAPPPAHQGRFEFGSYGRVGAGLDLTGRLGHPANVVANGPRLIEDSYAELELRREDDWGAVKSQVVANVAFFSPFFHFSGTVDQQVALRNLYAEATLASGFSAWAGSRMYRGDDIYLLNFWPLDDLNTVGGGVRYAWGEHTQLAFHVGVSRLDRPSQYQVVQANNPLGFGAVGIVRLDRPRVIESLKLQHEFAIGPMNLRASLYGEGHQISGGVRRNTVTGDESPISADWGLLVGGQLTAWMPGGRYAHLWVREALGLAIYDELATVTSLALDHTTRGAQSTRVAFSGGFDHARFGLIVGAYADLVRGAGTSDVSTEKYDEGALVDRAQ